MRWLARRLVFYAFAIWVALTINFLLPRLMPGDPIAGLLAHLNPSQLAANPGLIQTYQALLGGGHNSIWQDYITYLGRIMHFDFGLSTSNYPTPVSEVIGRTLPYSIFLVGVAFLLPFVLGTVIGMMAAWRRGGLTDSVVVPTSMTIGAFPAFLLRCRALSLGLKARWCPIQHAYDTGLTPGLSWAVSLQRVPSFAVTDPRDPRRLSNTTNELPGRRAGRWSSAAPSWRRSKVRPAATRPAEGPPGRRGSGARGRAGRVASSRGFGQAASSSGVLRRTWAPPSPAATPRRDAPRRPAVARAAALRRA